MLLQTDAALPRHERLALGERPPQVDPQSLDLAPAVVQQVQPGPRAVAREPADHHLAAEDAERPPLVRELPPDLERERARLAGFFQRVLLRAELHVDGEVRGWRLDDPEEQVAADEQVQHLAQRGRAVVDDGQVGDVGKIARGELRHEGHHLSEALEVRGIDLEDGVCSVNECLRRRQRGAPRGQVVGVLAGGIAQEAPSVRVDPRAARRRSPIRAGPDAGNERRVPDRQVSLAERHRREAGLAPLVHALGRHAQPLDPRCLHAGSAVDGRRPVEAREDGQPEEQAHTSTSWTLIFARSATPRPSPAAYSTCPGSRMMMLTLGSASRAAPSSTFRYCGERS